MKALLLTSALAVAAALPVQAQTGDSPSPTPGATGGTGSGRLNPAGPGMSSGTTSGAMNAGAGSGSGSAGGWSLLPGTRRGYVGLNLGRPDFREDCPATGFACDDADLRMHLYTGGLLNDWVGVEFGYQNEGKAERAGGDTKAQALNLSLVLHAPIERFHVYGKLGALYGRTEVSAAAGTTLATGKETGWGSSLAVGAGYDLTPSSGVVLEWARNRYRFAGDVRRNVDSLNLGYVYRF